MDLQTRKEKLDALNSRLRRKKFVAILLALFTLGVNAFAWFVFSTHSDYTYDGRVAAWDVEVKEGEQLVNNVIVAVDMKPGMTDFSKTYTINNLGEVTAKVSYAVKSFTILGRTVNMSSISNVDNYLQNYYPFSIQVSTNKTTIAPGESATFNVVVHWDFEDSTAYYQLNDIYDFNETFSYYTKSGSTYNVFNATSENYAANRNSLYLEKDDADTYFGMECGTYQDTTHLTCLELKLVLTVEQNS
ncbi:MAG: hypothetical protein J6X28_03545 [Bacilli bacterium]|nr:hypothetical protein [Bacilli bacterium]